MYTRMSLLKDLSEGSKEFNPDNLDARGILEMMFWDGYIVFNQNVASITPMGIEYMRENKNEL